jgi:hypothetical protein
MRMRALFDQPVCLAVICFVILWLCGELGIFLRRRRHQEIEDAQREDFNLVLGATLTLMGLIIGFTFSMAISRYDQRKNLEEGEANAIGTEYVRAQLLPAADAASVRQLLREYAAERIDNYGADNQAELKQLGIREAALQDKLWTAVRGPALAAPTPVTALTVAGMNDVLNSQGYTQAAWLNRIPVEAWVLLLAIALLSSIMVGFNSRSQKRRGFLAFVLPLVVAISFLLIADIDSPRHGIIIVIPQNLQILIAGMH